MSIDVHPTVHRDAAAEPDAPPPGPTARVIAAALAAGVATVLVLTMGVFAGGTESSMTGSVLLGFGLGWALVAALTARFTNRPQGWAAVPAAVMAVTGGALLVWGPQDATLSRLNWVWPPLVLALAVWMLVQVHRSVTGAGRWMLVPVIATLAVASSGATYENIAVVRDQDAYAAPGKTYDVNGHRMHLDCHGQGQPTVVLANGLGEMSTTWARIAPRVAGTTRVCAYDRPGQGWSAPAQAPQDGVAAARDLHELLDVGGEEGPYLLVGHSTGGTYSLTYAATYPQDVAGLVLLDSSSPEQLTAIPSFAGQYAVTRRVLALLPTLNRLGVSRLLPAGHLPEPAAATVQALSSTARYARAFRDEQSVLPEVLEQAQALATLDGRPLAVITASENVSNDGWVEAQDKLADLSTNRVHRTVNATHAGLLEDASGADASVNAIAEVLDAVRTGAHLPSP